MTNEELEAAMDSENPKHISECGELDWHELLDRAYLVASMFEQHVNNHHVVQLTPELKERCDVLVDALWGIYCSVPGYEEQVKKDHGDREAWVNWCNKAPEMRAGEETISEYFKRLIPHIKPSKPHPNGEW